jgi:hypothetical protein
LPSEFGADLSRVDTLPPDTDPAQSITIGPITPISEYHSPLLSGALVKLGSGELHVSQPPLFTLNEDLQINGGTLVASTTTVYGGTLQMSGGTLSFGSLSGNASITHYAAILRFGSGLNASYAQLGLPSPPIALPADISLPIASGTLLELTSSPEAPASILAPFVG